MNAVLPSSSLRDFQKTLGCFARISENLTIECKPGELLLSAINATRSAFLLVAIDASCFDRYEFLPPPIADRGRLADANHVNFQCQVAVKPFLAIFKGVGERKEAPGGDASNTSTIERCELKLRRPTAVDSTQLTGPQAGRGKYENNLKIQMVCRNGIRKTYSLQYEPVAKAVQAVVDSTKHHSTMQIRARSLKDALDHILGSPNAGGGSGGGLATAEELTMQLTNDHLLLTSFTRQISRSLDNRRRDERQVLKMPIFTSVTMDASELVSCDSPRSEPISFPIREFRAVVNLCDGLGGRDPDEQVTLIAHWGDGGPQPFQLDWVVGKERGFANALGFSSGSTAPDGDRPTGAIIGRFVVTTTNDNPKRPGRLADNQPSAASERGRNGRPTSAMATDTEMDSSMAMQRYATADITSPHASALSHAHSNASSAVQRPVERRRKQLQGRRLASDDDPAAGADAHTTHGQLFLSDDDDGADSRRTERSGSRRPDDRDGDDEGEEEEDGAVRWRTASVNDGDAQRFASMRAQRQSQQASRHASAAPQQGEDYDPGYVLENDDGGNLPYGLPLQAQQLNEDDSVELYADDDQPTPTMLDPTAAAATADAGAAAGGGGSGRSKRSGDSALARDAFTGRKLRRVHDDEDEDEDDRHDDNAEMGDDDELGEPSTGMGPTQPNTQHGRLRSIFD